MSVYIFALFMGLLAASVAILFRGRFEQALPCCICYVILTLYISGLIGSFVPGLYLVWLTLPAAGILCMVRSRKNLLSDIRAYVLTPGFFFMLIAYGAMIPCILKMQINSWDEFSHWGTVIKNFWYLNDFANLENSTTSFKGYPPAASLFAYFAQRFGGNYVECKSYAAYDFFYLALMCPYFCVITKRKDWFKAVVLGFCCILLPTLVWERVYDVTYVDALLGMQTALIFIAYLVYEDKGWRNATICLITIVLCLTKASGAGLAGIALVILMVAEWNRVKGKPSSEKRSAWITPGVMSLSLLLGKYSWDIYLKASGTAQAWNTSNLNVANVWELVTGKGPAYRYESIGNFFQTAAVEPIASSLLPMSCLAWIVLFIVMGAVVRKLVKSEENSTVINVCVWGQIAGVIIYALSLLLLYLFTYSESEALTAASFGRYMGTYLVAICAVLVVLLIRYLNGKYQWGALAIALTMGFTTYLPIYKAIVTADPVCADEYRNWPIDIGFQRVKEVLDQYEGNTPKVYYVHQNDSGYWYEVCQYGLTPYQIQKGGRFSFDPGARRENWEGELREGGFTHVLLKVIDDNFCESFSGMFEAEEADTGLFEINDADGQMKLKKIGEY